MTFSIGFRYQMFENDPHVMGESKRSPYNYDHFYGITASAIFRFDATIKEPGIEDKEKVNGENAI
jgi:hypothetical protein